MSEHSAEMRRCIADLDVVAVRRLWRHISPDFPQPVCDADVLAALHYARTQPESLYIQPLRRFYSHRWLLDHGLPSALPDELRPHAERVWPKIVSAVGIAVKAVAEDMEPVAAAVRLAMANAVMDAYSSGRTDPEFVKERMAEARRYAVKKLLGR